MADFFDYCCDACAAPFCERVNLMNLALGHVDDAYCLDCLAKQNNRTPEAMAAYCWRYVQARDCFKDPWQKFNVTSCPKLADHTCHCQQEAA